MCIPKFSEYILPILQFIYIVIRKPIVWGCDPGYLRYQLMLRTTHIMDNGYDQQTVGNVEINCMINFVSRFNFKTLVEDKFVRFKNSILR